MVRKLKKKNHFPKTIIPARINGMFKVIELHYNSVVQTEDSGFVNAIKVVFDDLIKQRDKMLSYYEDYGDNIAKQVEIYKLNKSTLDKEHDKFVEISNRVIDTIKEQTFLKNKRKVDKLHEEAKRNI